MRFWLLLGLGLASLPAYWQLGRHCALERAQLPVFFGWFGLCFSAQLGALWLARGVERQGRLALLILGFGLLFRCLLLPTAEITDDDVHRFLWDGRVVAAGLDPYRFSPQEVHDATHGADLSAYRPAERERLLRLVALANESEAAWHNFQRINYPGVRTVYPPGAQALFALAHRLRPESLRALKLLLLVCELATMLLLLATLRRLRLPVGLLLIHAWSPLAIKEFAATGHHDALALTCLALLLWLVAAGRGRLAGVALGLGALAKLYPLLFVPVLLRRLGPWGLLLLALTLGAGVALIGVPIGGLATFGAEWQFNAALFAPLSWLAGPVAARVLVALLLGLLGLAMTRPEGSPEAWPDRMLTMLTVALLLSPVIDPWYVTWMLPLLVLRPAPPLLLWSGTVALHYAWFLRDADQWWIRPLEYGPVLLVAGAWAWWRSRASPGCSDLVDSCRRK